jgi:hypothetical protein
MTIIEFFSKTALENIAGALLCKPDRVILVGDDRRKMERSARLYPSILRERGLFTEFICKTINPYDLQGIIQGLCDLVETYEDCVFDLTGGDELYLVAVGVMLERYPGRIECHRFNFRSDKLVDCDANGHICQTGSFDLSVEDSIRICGGEVVRDAKDRKGKGFWELTPELQRDVAIMWELCRKDPRGWNVQTAALSQLLYLFGAEGGMTLSVDTETAGAELMKRGLRIASVSGMLKDLQAGGLISALSLRKNLSFRIKNEQVKRCLTVAGQILELMVAFGLQALRDKKGTPIYHDVRVGVVVDWKGLSSSESKQIVNEIDVVAMNGAIPLFVSCKNGDFDVDELYKLNTVTEYFGAPYAKMALVAANMSLLGDRAEYLKSRMSNLGIRYISNAEELDFAEFEKKVRILGQ